MAPRGQDQNQEWDKFCNGCNLDHNDPVFGTPKVDKTKNQKKKKEAKHAHRLPIEDDKLGTCNINNGIGHGSIGGKGRQQKKYGCQKTDIGAKSSFNVSIGTSWCCNPTPHFRKAEHHQGHENDTNQIGKDT